VKQPSLWDITPGMVERLKSLISDSLFSATQISKMLCEEFQVIVSRNAVIGKTHRLGLRFRPIINKKVAPIKKRKRKVRKVVALPPITPVAINKYVQVSIQQLHSGVCHYPIGQSPPFKYCGDKTVNHTMYCEAHGNIMHIKPKKDWK